MTYRSLRECADDLERHGHLVRVAAEVDPYLEMAEIQRRLHAAQGPAVLFEQVKGSPFPALANLFGTVERARFIFRHTLEAVRLVVRAKADPASFLRRGTRSFAAPLRAGRCALHALPRRVRGGPVLAHSTTIGALPQLVSWPDDGGAFITLPQVYSENPDRPGHLLSSNIGMYRIQMSGGAYEPERQVGLHFQLQRGIGAHYARAQELGRPLPVSVFIGGPPAHTFAAVLPLPEGLTELHFAGMLAGRRVRLARRGVHAVSVDADFCITGWVRPGATAPEGPFGDHLGYYSLAHEFPVLEVERVVHRRDAIWPFTVVGRPPQEDTTFGALIHEITGAMMPVSIPGVRELHAVDAAGVHPLLLAIGCERYAPHQERRPRELLTVAHAVLGFGQASLAKVLVIAAEEDDRELRAADPAAFLQHVLERVDWRRDLHFETRTTIDTLDYSGSGLHEGSKLVVAACGAPARRLDRELPAAGLGAGVRGARLALPGVAVVELEEVVESTASARRGAAQYAASLDDRRDLGGLPLIVLVDDAEFAARDLRNFLWVTFTRCDPAPDVHGAGAFTDAKHWGCTGPLVIDSRIKPHHAPPLVEDPAVTARVDALFEKLAARGGPLAGVL